MYILRKLNGRTETVTLHIYVRSFQLIYRFTCCLALNFYLNIYHKYTNRTKKQSLLCSDIKAPPLPLLPTWKRRQRQQWSNYHNDVASDISQQSNRNGGIFCICFCEPYTVVHVLANCISYLSSHLPSRLSWTTTEFVSCAIRSLRLMRPSLGNKFCSLFT